jgi:hypothetical protein
MKVIVAEYSAYREFEIPDDVFLLSAEDNDGAGNDQVGSWWIKWDRLHYVDKDGKWQELNGGEVSCEGKRPDEITQYEREKRDDECFYCAIKAIGTYGEKNLPMCQNHKSKYVVEVEEEEEKTYCRNLGDEDNLYISQGKTIRRATPEEVKEHNDKWERNDLRWRLAYNMCCPESKVPESMIDEILSKVK